MPWSPLSNCQTDDDQFNASDYSVKRQFVTSAFNTAVRRREFVDVEDDCTSHNCILSAIFLPNSIKFGGNLTKF